MADDSLDAVKLNVPNTNNGKVKELISYFEPNRAIKKVMNENPEAFEEKSQKSLDDDHDNDSLFKELGDQYFERMPEKSKKLYSSLLKNENNPEIGIHIESFLDTLTKENSGNEKQPGTNSEEQVEPNGPKAKTARTKKSKKSKKANLEKAEMARENNFKEGENELYAKLKTEFSKELSEIGYAEEADREALIKAFTDQCGKKLFRADYRSFTEEWKNSKKGQSLQAYKNYKEVKLWGRFNNLIKNLKNKNLNKTTKDNTEKAPFFNEPKIESKPKEVVEPSAARADQKSGADPKIRLKENNKKSKDLETANTSPVEKEAKPIKGRAAFFSKIDSFLLKNGYEEKKLGRYNETLEVQLKKNKAYLTDEYNKLSEGQKAKMTVDEYLKEKLPKILKKTLIGSIDTINHEQNNFDTFEKASGSSKLTSCEGQKIVGSAVNSKVTPEIKLEQKNSGQTTGVGCFKAFLVPILSKSRAVSAESIKKKAPSQPKNTRKRKMAFSK